MPNLMGTGKRVKMSMGTPGTGVLISPCPISFKEASLEEIIEQFGLEGTFKDHLVQPLCHGQGHLSLDQIVQNPIHPDLEHL